MNRLKEYRKKTLTKASDIADALGVSVQAYYAYERDDYKPSVDTLTKIASFYNTTIDDLIDVPAVEDAERFLDSLPKTHRIPRLGVIACGRPIMCDENYSGFDDVPEQVHCDFSLMCQGDSMTGARINDGDIVYIRSQHDVDNREIAAVLIDDETVTLKRVFKNDLGKPVLLLPENPRFDPIDCTRHRIRILGKAVGFMSRL